MPGASTTFVFVARFSQPEASDGLYAPILAVDLGKFNSVLCWLTTSTGGVGF